MSQSATLDLNLHPKQGEALNTRATEVLYGGAAGGGKSHLMRVAAIIWCSMIAGLQVYLFRRIRDDLVKNHMEGPKGFHMMLAPWVLCGLVRIVEDEIRFWNGSKIYLCHCKDEKDVYKYQGAEIHVLIIDELTHFTEAMYRFLRNRVRMVGIVLPAMYAAMFPRILCGANPGNIGHQFVKATWIDGAEPMALRPQPPSEGGMLRQYVPAQLDDNPSMAEDDPGYEGRLEGLGSAQLVRAMRHGDWSVVDGAFFDCWSPDRHVVRPFAIPKEWSRFLSGDWGSARPFSFGWWAIASDTYRTTEGVTLPRGCLIRYREWYGCVPGKPNTGLKLPAEQVGRELIRLTGSEELRYGVVDPAMFASDGGPTIAQRLQIGAREADGRLPLRPADNKRVAQRGAMGGWDQMRSRLIGDLDGNPMIVTFSTCVDSIRTIPALQHDASRPEDLDTDGEDHCFVGETLVRTPGGDVALAELPEDGWLIGPNGKPTRYRNPRIIAGSAPLVEVKFEDGSAVKSTADHLYLTEQGWCEAKDLSGLAVLLPSRSSARLCRSLRASDTTAADATSKGRGCGSTRRSIAAATGRFLLGITSTIATKTARTTSRKTSKRSLGESISLTTRAPGLNKAAKSWPGAPDPPPSHGTGLRLDANGTRGTTTPSPPGCSTEPSRSHAHTAAAPSLAPPETVAGFARTPAGRLPAAPAGSMTSRTPARCAPACFGGTAIGNSGHARWLAGGGVLRCVSVAFLSPSENQPVWCLTVPEWGAFVLANGAVVKNCADEWRYASMSRPWTPTAKPKPKAKPDAYDRDDGEGASNWKTL